MRENAGQMNSEYIESYLSRSSTNQKAVRNFLKDSGGNTCAGVNFVIKLCFCQICETFWEFFAEHLQETACVLSNLELHNLEERQRICLIYHTLLIQSEYFERYFKYTFKIF